MKKKTKRKRTPLGIEIVLLRSTAKKHTLQFKTEAEAAEYLKATHATEAPISFTYTDGTPLNSTTIERIYAIVFEE